jgi:hypothetical protein
MQTATTPFASSGAPPPRIVEPQPSWSRDASDCRQPATGSQPSYSEGGHQWNRPGLASPCRSRCGRRGDLLPPTSTPPRTSGVSAKRRFERSCAATAGQRTPLHQQHSLVRSIHQGSLPYSPALGRSTNRAAQLGGSPVYNDGCVVDARGGTPDRTADLNNLSLPTGELPTDAGSVPRIGAHEIIDFQRP